MKSFLKLLCVSFTVCYGVHAFAYVIATKKPPAEFGFGQPFQQSEALTAKPAAPKMVLQVPEEELDKANSELLIVPGSGLDQLNFHIYIPSLYIRPLHRVTDGEIEVQGLKSHEKYMQVVPLSTEGQLLQVDGHSKPLMLKETLEKDPFYSTLTEHHLVEDKDVTVDGKTYVAIK